MHVGLPADHPWFEYLTKTFKLLSDIFLNLIKLLVAPLVLSTIVVGIAHMGDSSALGRIGMRAIIWFITASFISIALGLLMVNLFQPGVGAPIPDAAEAAKMVGEVKKLDAWEFTLSIFPKNALEALATNNILQILVFSIFAGVALSAIGEKGAPLVRGAEALAEMMLQITGYVMRFAPFAVFGAIANVVADSGLGILATYFELLVEFYVSLVLLWIILLTMGWVFLRQRIWMLIRYIREPLLIAFSTASSEAALPKMFEQLDRFGVPRRISGFMLPLGYSFNLDGSMMYMSFATIFIAQAYGIDLSISTQIADPADADDQFEGHRRGAARQPGGDHRHARAVRPAGRRRGDHPGDRPVPRHGPHRDQRRRQCGGDQRHHQVGRHARSARTARSRTAARPGAYAAPWNPRARSS